MKSSNKSIRINGKSVEVTDEVYKVYTKYDRKMRYFEKDLKQERLAYDELGNIIKRVPSREDSLDRLLDESFMQFEDISENVEDTVLNKISTENLHKALDKLTDNEYDLIISLKYKDYVLRSTYTGYITNIGSFDRQYPYRETDFYNFDKFLFTTWRDKPNGKGKDIIPWGVEI